MNMPALNTSRAGVQSFLSVIDIRSGNGKHLVSMYFVLDQDRIQEPRVCLHEKSRRIEDVCGNLK